MGPQRKELDSNTPLTIVIVGGSGDLARRKILPALFQLHCRQLLPKKFHIIGFSRTPMSHEEFRQKTTEFLTCRYVPQSRCQEHMDDFLAHCYYATGNYDSADSFLDLFQTMKKLEGERLVHRLYYLAIPPSIFLNTARSLGNAGLVHCGPSPAWSRVVIEKPFGRDRQSSDVMAQELAKVFGERDIYRIDHYLGKEVIQNLMVLRFANPIFEPLWSREYIESVQISWKEDIGIEGRGGYFDEYGIIRDVMQNHLLQILSLAAMEKPASLDSQAVRDEKVRVLKCVPALTRDDLVIGQYRGIERDGKRQPSYAEEDKVRPDSITPTYAAAVLRIQNERWEGVPFLIRAGKALDGRMTEVRVRFRARPQNLYQEILPDLPHNELVIRIQPDEAIYFKIVNKVPGLSLNLVSTDLDLKYKSAFKGDEIPDAYETLLVDALRGEKSLFIRNDELAAAWDIFTPVLHELEEKKVRPELYDFGGKGPKSTDKLLDRYGKVWE